MDRDKLISEQIQDIGTDVFPDNEVEWQVVSVRHKGEYSCVEAKAVPPTVGYPSFRFVISFNAAKQALVPGTYCLREGQWTLLCSSPELPKDWRELGFAND